jgi:hypothetical protein
MPVGTMDSIEQTLLDVADEVTAFLTAARVPMRSAAAGR